MQADANKALVFEMVDAVARSWWTVIAGACLGLAGAVFMLHYTPKEYVATAKILITPPRIDKTLLQSTVTEDPTRQLMALEEAVISEPYMKQLMEKHYSGDRDPEQLQNLMRGIRRRVEVKPTATLQTGWLSFALTFRAQNPQRAANVVNTLAELYIAQNKDARTNQARETTRTLENRLESSRLAFEEKDRELNAFIAGHRFETEAQLAPNLQLLENSQRDLEHNLDNQKFTQSRILELVKQEDAMELGEESLAQKIDQLEEELENLLVHYSDAHPEVVKKKRLLEDLRKTATARPQNPATPAPPSTDPKVLELQKQIEAARHEMDVLKTEEGRLRRQITEYERRIQAVPDVQPRLTALETDRSALHARFLEQQDKLDQARESEFLEESQMATQLRLAQRAEPARQPVYPKPERFYGMGLAGGLILFVGPLLARRALNPPISSEAGLRAISDYPVLVSIPRIDTPGNRRRRMTQFFRNFGLSLASAAGLVVVFFFFR